MFSDMWLIIILGIVFVLSVLVVVYVAYLINKINQCRPEPTANTSIGICAYQTDDSLKSFDAYSEGITIKILGRNHLSKLAVIHPDYTVEEFVAVNDPEDILKQELDSSFKTGKYDLQTEGESYQYRFVFLLGIDGSYNLTLFYTKWSKEGFWFEGISDIGVWGLANSNAGDPKYDGERRMADQYRKILRECTDYMA